MRGSKLAAGLVPALVMVAILAFFFVTSRSDPRAAGKHQGGRPALVQPRPATTAPTETREPLPSTVMVPCYEDIENGGLPITRSGGVSRYGAAANQQRARSENIWSTTGRCSRLTIGQRVSYSFDILPQLGSTGSSVWETVSQLQGPTTGGTWLGPPVALVIESGQWRVAGGYPVPNDYGGSPSGAGYTKRLSKVKVDTWQHWAFDVLLGGAGTGSVTAWLDGTKVVDGFKPPRGTMYTAGGGFSHAYLQLKSGLYTGAGKKADIPTRQRVVLIRNMRSDISKRPGS